MILKRYLFIFLLGMCGSWATLPGLYAQPEGLPPEAQEQLEQLSPSERSQLINQVQDWRSQGLSDQQIQDRLMQMQQGLPPQGKDPSIEKRQPAPGLNGDPPSKEKAGSDSQKEVDEARDPVEEAEKEAEDDSKADREPGGGGTSSGSGIFGHNIFRNQDQYVKAVSLIPGEGYLVGPGDVFNVTIWNCSELSESLTVGDNGAIEREFMGKVYVAGLTYAKTVQILKQRYRNFISGCSQIEIFMGQSQRAITVNIVGEVKNPGPYKINAALPAFNALFEAGGVSTIGSVRNILIKRQGDVVDTLDLYDYLIYGDNSPIYLAENDFIFVPVQGKIASINGAVRRSASFELRENENLASLVDLAGGLTYDAKVTEVSVFRLEPDTKREAQVDVQLEPIIKDPNIDFGLLGGERVQIRTLNKGIYNIVQAYGNVQYPGAYQLLPGERVSDLVKRAGGLGPDAYLKQAYIVRTDPRTDETLYIPIDLSRIFLEEDEANNIELQYFDALVIFSESTFRDSKSISIQGQVRRPGVYPVSPTMTLKDLILFAGGIKENADFNNIELAVITEVEDVDADLLEEDAAVNLDGKTPEAGPPSDPTRPMQPKTAEPEPAAEPEETGAPEASEETGEAEEAGAEGEEETLAADKELIRRIAISENWENDLTLDTLLVAPYNRVRIYSKYDFVFYKYIQVNGAVQSPGRFQLYRGMTLKDALYRAGGLAEDADVNEVELHRDIDLQELGPYGTSTDKRGVIRIEIDENWQTSSRLDSIELAGYNKLVIRSEREFRDPGKVEVRGLVNNPGSFPLLPNMTLRDLFYQAKGLKKEADFNNIELVRVIEVLDATGEIIPQPTVIKRVATRQNWREDDRLDSIEVNTYDMIFVRKNPDFELQELVNVDGEVITPGEYVKSTKSERLSSLVARAGGVTDIADLKGAYLQRQGIGNIALKLEKALRRPGSKYDIHLLEGDRLYIPPQVDVVTINGNVMVPGTTVMFERNKTRFKYYVNLAGGFEKKTKKKRSTVTYVDGRVKRAKSFLFFKNYPKINQGAVINVARKEEKQKEEKEPKERQSINIENILAGTMTLLTFWLLLDRATN